MKDQYVGLTSIYRWAFNDPREETEFRFSDAAGTAHCRSTFTASYTDFDGIDLNWKFSGDLDHGGCVEDLEPLLVQEIRKAVSTSSEW